MKITIASDQEAVVAVWRQELASVPGVSFSADPQTAFPADAVVLSGIFAFDRYGGRPRNDAAQILVNRHDDGFPGLVVVPPSLPAVFDEAGRPVIREDFADVSPAYHAVSHTMSALREWNRRDERHVETVVFHLPMMGMNDPADHRTPASVRRALRDHITGSTEGN
jgi:hypothetical protein